MLNARVVVVGGSDVALSFLEHLLLQSDLNYSNITLVSKYGLQRGRSMGKGDCQFTPWGLYYDQATMQRLSMQSRVRVIADTLSDIHCDQKHIVLSDGSVLPYDHLVLTPGLQDQTAGVLGVDLNTNHGLFSITDAADVDDMLAFLEEASPQKIVVYGNTLQALTTIRGLLDNEVAASWISWAFPNKGDSPMWCNNDQEVNQRVCTELIRLGVKILPHTHLLDVVHDELGMISSATFKQTTVTGDDNKITKKVELPCQMLIGCHVPDVDAAIFTAVTENSLVYDGRLVVSSTFATADPSVFGAGTIAKFSRKYGSSLPHERYNSREVGQRLAESILTAMDPVVVDTEKDEAMHSTLPTLGMLPKVQEAMLPGGIRYFSATKPSLIAPKKPKVLVSNEKDNLVRLVFDDLNILVSITYIGTAKNVHCKNLSKMVGFPSNYLNRILWRYEKKLIPDLLGFLSAPWATALGHEAFPELCDQITDGVVERENQMSELLETYITHIQSRTKQQSNAVSDMVEDLLPDEIKRHIQVKMLQFLNLHANHLPGYQISAEKPPPIPEKVSN
jgi:NADH dehydrogenase FAD-containing subunit